MSYLVLARKWRPQTFEAVIGQGHVTRTLQNALGNDRVAHALLFSGPRGVGKTSVARILAKALNCENGPAPDPCNDCAICRQITAGHNVDVNEIDGASNRGIDEIRQLREDIRFQPAQCRFRIYIIDEVHMLTKEAFNALLKTLEEPPSHAYFVFATTEPKKIPATIHSRCQHFEFRRLPEKELADHLDHIVEKEGLGLPREATLLLAREAEGSVRDSLSLLDQVAAFGARTYQDVCEALGVIGIKTTENLAYYILQSDIPSVLATIDKAYRMGSDLVKLAEDLLKFLRDIALLKRLKPQESAELVNIDTGRIQNLRKKFSSCTFSQILQAMHILSSSMEDIHRSSNPKMTLEIIFLRLCTLREFSGIDELIQKVEALLKLYRETGGLEQGGGKEQQRPAPHASPALPPHSEEPPPAEPENIQMDSVPDTEVADLAASPAPDTEKGQTADKTPESHKDIKACWNEFTETVREKRPSLGSALDASCIELKALDESSMEITCRPDMMGEMLCDRENAALLNHLAEKFFNRPVNIKFKIQQAPQAPDSKSRTAKGKRLLSKREQLINKPLVQETLNIFQARISGVTLYTNRKYRKKYKR